LFYLDFLAGVIKQEGNKIT